MLNVPDISTRWLFQRTNITLKQYLINMVWETIKKLYNAKTYDTAFSTVN